MTITELMNELQTLVRQYTTPITLGSIIALFGLMPAIFNGLMTMRGKADKPNDNQKTVLAYNEDDEMTDDRASIQLRQAFWVCDDCGQEFRIPDSTLPPLKCPNCGVIRYVKDEIPDDEKFAVTHECPLCHRHIQMLDGDTPEHCPYCGQDF